jgi:tyrosine-protein kinase Etk/Wzc
MTNKTSFPEPSEQVDSLPSVLVTERAAEEGYEISLLDLLIVVAERKRVVFWVSAIFAIVAAVISLLLPEHYTATATLLPPQQNASIGSVMNGPIGGIGSIAALAGGNFRLNYNPNDAIVGMLKSRTVEDAIVQRFGLMQEYRKHYLSDARKKLEKRATVDGTGRDNLIRISIVDGDPRRAAELANGYVEQFRDLSQHLAITEASQRRLFFERELEQSKDKLASAEEALKQTEQSTGLIQLDSQARALIQSAATLRAQIAAREVQIQGMQTYATGENAQLVQAQRELESLRAQYAKLVGSEDGSGELLIPKGRVPEAGMEYIRRLRDVKYSETIFEILARQFEVAKLDEARQGALIQVVDPAIPPDKRSFPKRSLIVIGATVLGLCFGIFVALIQTGLERMMDDPETSEKIALLKRALSATRTIGP